MANLLERKSIPLGESSIKSVVQRQIQDCANLEDFAKLLKAWSHEEANDFGRLTIPIQVGGAYRLAEKSGLFGRSKDPASRERSKVAREKFANDADYSQPHLRNRGRLYDDCLEMEPSSEFCSRHADELTRRRRKREGIEFRLSVIKAWKTYRDAIHLERLNHVAAIAKANETLPEEKATAKSALSSSDLAKRKDAAIVALFGLVKAWFEGISLTQDRTLIFDKWPTPRAMFDEMNASKSGDDEDGICERLGESRSAKPDVILLEALDFFRQANDSWASPDMETGEEDDMGGGSDDPSSSSSSGTPPPATGETMPLRNVESDVADWARTANQISHGFRAAS